MNNFRKFNLLIKEIGIPEISAYAVYQFKLRSGILRRLTPPGGHPEHELKKEFLSGSSNHYSQYWRALTSDKFPFSRSEDAESLVHGLYRPFHGDLQPLSFNPISSTLSHWTNYSNEVDGIDIKCIWEPARFCWSLDLARTYQLTGDDRYAEFFWKKFEEFIQSDPVNLGPNWVSAQEVAIRMMMWIIALGAFRPSDSTTPERLSLLTKAILQHAGRIPITMGYARAQNNNHILSEALGLVLAGDFLDNLTPRSGSWKITGEKEFERALLDQIKDDGTYSQHSANYHRLMLQLAMLYEARLRKQGRQLSKPVKQKLVQASNWLIAQLDPITGRLPNLGHNDGTLMFSFGCEEYRDYRPTGQAASLAFLGKPCLPPGKWDELPVWLGLTSPESPLYLTDITSPAIHKVGAGDVWGTLRGVKFSGRPAHADQLHVDLWWNGDNIARDAGTYSYNSPLPWQNALDSTRVHNTVTVDHLDQMERVSRFLWLDQAQAKWLKGSNSNVIQASHNGYRALGITHIRSLEFIPDSGFLVTDELTTGENPHQKHESILHWLLPDWKWNLEGTTLDLVQGNRKISLQVKASLIDKTPLLAEDVSLIRAGQSLLGRRADPILGWESVIYNEKCPALSFSCSFWHSGSIKILTEWILTDD